MRKKISWFMIFTALIFFESENCYSQPKDSDYVLGYGGAALYLGSEFLFKENLAPDKAKWSEPNNFDTFFRNHLKLENNNLETAALYSDILLKGIFIPSVLWSPLLTDYDYNKMLLLNVQVAAATGILTNLTKFVAGRERPYSYFKTQEPKWSDDFLSFFSGHASLTFALATSTSMLLEKKHADKSGLIWSSSVLLATMTSWLRIASDRHYMSDVLTGAIAGTLCGYIITKNQKKRLFSKKGSNGNFTMYFVVPL